ncbi:MAG: radical SAM protein [Deltaproteobacteria bacterium RIFOXYD12_FULL_57_12]|nr:MAG: radical SAM protein [Deltaproteobacteria bacterium RIFOXYD12_FULL_57_12]
MAPEQSLLISELFYSIQGESSFSGLACVFFRLAGCNLRCAFCDARYTYEEPGHDLPLAEFFLFADRYPGALVEITGGEPLLQENVYPLLSGLLATGRTVLLETNGSVSLARVPAEVIKIMDLKCPESGMHDRMLLDNFQYLAASDEIKFVISSREDYDWAVRMIKEHDLARLTKLLFSPNKARLRPALLADWLLADQMPVRLQLQLHTLLWPDRSRGA